MDSNLTALLSAISNLCKVAGVILAAHGLADTGFYFWLQIAGGSVMFIGPAIWDVYVAIVNIRKASAIGVAAGILMTTSGKALASDGKTVVSLNDGATPPLMPTQATAAQIVKDFGPLSSEIAKK